MSFRQQIYDQLPNPSEIEDMIGELEHFVNPVHGVFADFKDKGLFSGGMEDYKGLIDKADEAGSMLNNHLDKFHAIMQLADTISQKEQKR